MLKSSLCSITFRDHTPDEILALCQKAGIQAIEWGGDVHSPHGEIAAAREIGEKTRKAGLAISAYGSYYRGEDDDVRFEEVLASAKAMQTDLIRIWAGRKGSNESTQEDRDSLASAIRRAVELASEEEITVALEYHGQTLTDTMESAHQFLEEVGSPALKLFWQPRTGGTFEGDLPELDAALPRLANVHCFHWGPGGWKDRYALSEGEKNWRSYLSKIRNAGGDRFVTLEFVKDNDPAQLIADAKTLNSLLRESA